MTFFKIVRLRKYAQIEDCRNPGILRGVLDQIRPHCGPGFDPALIGISPGLTTLPTEKTELLRREFPDGLQPAARGFFWAVIFYLALVRVQEPEAAVILLMNAFSGHEKVTFKQIRG